MHPLDRLRRRTARRVVGLMTGTSMDGIDAALVSIAGHGHSLRCIPLVFRTFRYPPDLRTSILQWYTGQDVPVRAVSECHARLGGVLAGAVRRLCRAAGLPLADVDLVGMHGQTVWHGPRRDRRGMTTLQIGDPAAVAALTGLPTVGDFRAADTALGGQGAPLVPYVDYLLFRSRTEHRVLLNIGGIANLTSLPRGARASDVRAFDCGPGNMVIDQLMAVLFGRPFDRHGAVAAAGTPSEALLSRLLQHPYFQRRPPKSTGREMFGPAYCEALLKEARRRRVLPEDIIATATLLTARAVVDSMRLWPARRATVNRLIVSGGGVHNRTLMAMLKRLVHPTPVETTAAYGVSPDAKEAIAFAILADAAVFARPANLPAVTGARRSVVLGKICLP